MSISLSLTHAEWQERKLNLIDVPGDPSFQGEARSSLRVVEGALVVLSGVMGVEVGTARVWKRAEELGIARVLFVNMLDRERADFFRALGQLQEQLSERCVAVHLPIGAEHEMTGIVDVLHMCAYTSPDGAKEPEPGPIPEEMASLVAEYREKLLDEVVQTDEALMEKYLEGEELGVEEVAHALKDAVTRGEVFPVACGIATKNLGTHALLDLIVEGVPSPAKAGSITHIEGADTAAFVFKTIADPFAGRINLFRVLQGSVKPDQTLVDARTHAKERMGSLLFQQGKEHIPARGVRAGGHRRGREAEGGADRRPAARQGGRGHGHAGDRLPGAGDELRRDAEGRRATRRRSRPRSAGSPRRIRPCACGATSRPGRRSSPG